MCFRRDQSRAASRTRTPEFAECPWTSSPASLSPPSSQLYFTHSFIFQSLCLTCFGLVCFGTFSDTMIDLNCFCNQWCWCPKTCRFSQQDNVLLAAEAPNAYSSSSFHLRVNFSNDSIFFNVLQHTYLANHKVTIILIPFHCICWKGKNFKKNLFDRDLWWCSWQAAQTVWNSQLLKLFESSPWPQFSNRFKASLNSHFSRSVWIFRCRNCKKLDQYYRLPSGRLELFWLLDRGPLPCRIARGRRQRSFHAQIIPSTQVLFKIMVITMVTRIAIVMNLNDDD